MNNFKFITLLQLIKDCDNIEEIKDQYISLLSQLTTATNLSSVEFINKVNEISDKGDIIICYIIDDKKLHIIGTGTVIYEPKIIHNCMYVGHIEDIVVDSNYRSNGIAKELLQGLMKMAKEHKCYKVILDCNSNLTKFYEKNGFIYHGNQMALYF